MNFMYPVVVSPVSCLTFHIATNLPWFFFFKLFPALCELIWYRNRQVGSLPFLQIKIQQFNLGVHCLTHEHLSLPNDLLSTAAHSAAPWPGAQCRDHAQCAGELQQAFTPELPTDLLGRPAAPSLFSWLQLELFSFCSLPSCSWESWGRRCSPFRHGIFGHREAECIRETLVL